MRKPFGLTPHPAEFVKAPLGWDIPGDGQEDASAEPLRVLLTISICCLLSIWFPEVADKRSRSKRLTLGMASASHEPYGVSYVELACFLPQVDKVEMFAESGSTALALQVLGRLTISISQSQCTLHYKEACLFFTVIAYFEY